MSIAHGSELRAGTPTKFKFSTCTILVIQSNPVADEMSWIYSNKSELNVWIPNLTKY
jgi:hypothetical protein